MKIVCDMLCLCTKVTSAVICGFDCCMFLTWGIELSFFLLFAARNAHGSLVLSAPLPAGHGFWWWQLLTSVPSSREKQVWFAVSQG